MLIFVANIRPARTFWNSTHCLLSPFKLDWSRNLWHNPMWNMAVNNISYPIYPLSSRTEKCYSTKMIPFFFCSVYNTRPGQTGRLFRANYYPITTIPHLYRFAIDHCRCFLIVNPLIRTYGQKKGYTVYMSNHSKVNLNTHFLLPNSNSWCIKT